MLQTPHHPPTAEFTSMPMRTMLALLVLCVGVAACSSTSKQSASSPASTTAASNQESGSSASVTTASGKKAAPVNMCATFPAAQIASLAGTSYTKTREADDDISKANTCNYYSDSGTGGMSITVFNTGGATSFKNMMATDKVSQSSEHVTPVSGIGDKAFSAQDGLHVLFGDRQIYVAGLTSIPAAKAVVEAVQAKLP